MAIPPEYKEQQKIVYDYWKPTEAGESLAGEILQIQEGKFGKQYLIKAEGGNLMTPSHEDLQGKMVNSKTGSKVYIEYQGKQKKEGADFESNIYKVGIL